MGMPAHQASPPGGAAQWPYHSFLPLGALPVVTLRLAGDHKRLLVEVSDHDPRPPIPTVADPEHDGGRGLLLVAAVSELWGYYYPATDPVHARGRGPAPEAG